VAQQAADYAHRPHRGPINGLSIKGSFAPPLGPQRIAALPLCTAPMAPGVPTPWVSTRVNTKARICASVCGPGDQCPPPAPLITLAPTCAKDHPLETLVAAYCPLPEESSGSHRPCGDVGSYCGAARAPSSKAWPLWVRWWRRSSLAGVVERNLSRIPRSARSLASWRKPAGCCSTLDRESPPCPSCLGDMIRHRTSGERTSTGCRQRGLRPESLAMVFDPPGRVEAYKVVAARHRRGRNAPVHGLCLRRLDRRSARWASSEQLPESPADGLDVAIELKFQRSDGESAPGAA